MLPAAPAHLITRLLATTATAMALMGVWSGLQAQPTEAPPAPAPAAVANAVKSKVESTFKGRAMVTGVFVSPVPGLVEVQIGREVYYADEKANFFIQGPLISLKDGRNLTAPRLEALRSIDFSQLPLNLAVKSGAPNGPNVIAVFEDPYCSYCRKFRETLVSLEPNTTVYTFYFPTLRAESSVIARNAWCAKEPAKAWNDWMLRGKTPPVAPAGCSFPEEQIRQLGAQLGVTGTPTSFLQNGKRVSGAISKEDLVKAFAAKG